jgi:type IV secretion system protein VirD4
MARNNPVTVILDYVFGAADTLTAQYFSDLLGVATAETQSVRKEAGIEGSFEFGQKNISTLKRNLLNADEILRIPYNQLLVNIRGNKPLLLNKMVYTEHELAKKLKDVSISEYKPNWNKQENPKQVIPAIPKEEPKKQEKIEDFEEITLDNF